MDGSIMYELVDIQPILEKLTVITDNQVLLAEKLSESAKTFEKNQKSILENFEALDKNQSVMIVSNDLLNQRIKNQNIGTMMIVLVLGILVGIGLVSLLKGGKK